MKLIFICFVIAIGFLLWLNTKQKNKEGKEKPPYFPKPALLNEKEQALFHRLKEAFPEHHVMSQVRLADIIEVKSNNRSTWQTWQNKIDRKSVDFVICNKSFAVQACIELDGKTHEREDRQKADRDKDEALKTADIAIMRTKASKLPTTEEIKTLLKDAVKH